MTRSPVTDFKAVKNDTEVEGTKDSAPHYLQRLDNIRAQASDRAISATALRLYATLHGWRNS